mgnify:FL=1
MRREWTEWEVRYLEKKYVGQPVEKTAKKLNRTINSVKRKAAKLDLNHYTNFLSAKVVAKCFGSDVSVVIRWINKFDLPCKKVICGNQTRYLIENEKFWKWAENNKNIINWGKYERQSLLPEPDWLRETIRNYNTPNTREKYTDDDIVKIRVLLSKGLSYAEIAKETGRTYYGIDHLCGTIYSERM